MALDSLHGWLNSEYFEKALNSGEEKKLEVISSKIEKATAPGENSASHVYRATLLISRDGARESISVIVKVELCDAGMGQIISKANAFQKEIDVFNIVIPEAQKLLEECSDGKLQSYAPKCYYTDNGPPASVIIMEDLKVSGYRLSNLSGILDMKHSILAINTLAVHHAASVVLFAKHPERIQQFQSGLYDEEMAEYLKKMFNPTLRNLAFEAGNWFECKGEVANKLHELTSHSAEYLNNSVKTDEKDFKVLAHQDVRLNNIMYTYSHNGEPTHAKFVDYQMSTWTSPAVDLSYFIIANASVEIVLKPEIMLEEYFKTLCETLTTLGHGHLCPPKEYLYDQYDKRCKFGIIVGLVVRCFTIKQNSKVDSSGADSNKKNLSYFTDSYKKDMKKMLPYFVQRGWL